MELSGEETPQLTRHVGIKLKPSQLHIISENASLYEYGTKIEKINKISKGGGVQNVPVLGNIEK